jgi:hypothetical protein
MDEIRVCLWRKFCCNQNNREMRFKYFDRFFGNSSAQQTVGVTLGQPLTHMLSPKF